MAIELPGPVADFLQFIGITWPNINEDAVREFGQHVRDFADNISSAHDSATQTIQQVGQSYQGSSYDALFAKWSQMSSSHMTELVDGCNVLATALDAGADTIVGMKTAAIAELAVLAASFVADQAAAVFTFGLAEAAEAAIIAGARKAVSFLEQELTQYVIGKIIEAGVQPLIAVVGKAVDGLVYSAVQGALGTSTGGAGTGFQITPDAVREQAQTFHDHAQTVAGHAQTFTANLSSLNFT